MGMKEEAIAARITDLATKLAKGDYTNLWVPTHLVHDSEMDDLLCWVLLKYVHKQLGSDLQVLVQLPPKIDPAEHAAALGQENPNLDGIAGYTAFRDVDSKNETAVRH